MLLNLVFETVLLVSFSYSEIARYQACADPVV